MAKVAKDQVLNTGQRVRASGHGRTANWGEIVGTVLRATRKAVFVCWDGTAFDDQMRYAEVEVVDV